LQALRTRWRLVATAAVVVAAAAVVLPLTVFSSSGSTSADAATSTNSDTATSKTEQAMLNFARCMRDNGVPNFPDPVANADGTFGFVRPQGVSQTALTQAFQACQTQYDAIPGATGPGSGDNTDVQDGLLNIARCMRANGIPEFPDPQPGTDLITGLHGLFKNYDLNSPRVSAAIQRCQTVISQVLAPLHGGS
jgi:hypothetical protein